MRALNRRQVLALAAAAAAGCEWAARAAEPPSTGAAGPTAADARPRPAARVVDAGPVGDYGSDKVYDQFREQGVFVVRREKKLFALSSICTHKGCKVRSQADGTYLCKCHGSRFDADGRVTNPPAKRDLPRLSVALDGRRHVLINLDRPAGAPS